MSEVDEMIAEVEAYMAEVEAYLDLITAIEAAMYPVYVLEMVQGLKPGDILHIQIGGYMEDGQPPYIPDDETRAQAKAEWEKVVPEGVKVIVTHVWEHASVISVGS